jgi:choline dehydrogenase
MSAFLTAVYHGQNGPIAVSDLSWTTPLVNAFLAAGQVLGYPVRDLNGHQQTGMFNSIIKE